jgi:RimJ/RimL family protein N-acetyltransferase
MNNVQIRQLQDTDLELTLAWRNDPEIYQGFYTQSLQHHTITWDEHVKWNKSRNADWRTFIIIYDNHRVGVVTLGQLDHWSPEIGYYVGAKDLWGKGIGKAAVQLVLDYIKSCGREYCHTTVIDTNMRSIRLLKSLGFVRTCDARPGESYYMTHLK